MLTYCMPKFNEFCSQLFHFSKAFPAFWFFYGFNSMMNADLAGILILFNDL